MGTGGIKSDENQSGQSDDQGEGDGGIEDSFEDVVDVGDGVDQDEHHTHDTSYR
jgi:hypothetical protein